MTFLKWYTAVRTLLTLRVNLSVSVFPVATMAKFVAAVILSVSVTDNITAATNFAIVATGKTDTLRFTRNVNKVRTAVYHFRNVIYRPLDPIHFLYRYVASSDTISYTGTVTGID